MAQVQDATGNPILANVEASGAFAALNDEALVTLFGQAVAAVQIAGLAGAITISFEESVDGVNYQSISGVRRADGLVATSTTANGVWSFTIGGAKKFRARASAVAGGTATVSVVAGQGTGEPAFGGAVTVTPSGTQDVNLTKVAGTAVTVGSGVLGAGTQRVVLATDQPAVPISAASLPLPTGAATSALQTQPGVDIGDVTVNNAAGAAAVNIQDGGNSITVDAVSLPLPTGAATEATLATRLAEATFTTRIPVNGQALMAASVPVVVASNQSAIPISAASLPLPTGAATAALQTQPGVDIGDVTINNAAGAAAVNIQDGGNSITVDGTVAVSGAVDTELPAAAALSDAFANPTAPAVGAFLMVWNGASWVRLPGGGAGAVVQGSVANGVADAGNPVGVGAQARTTNPTAVTDGQRVTLKADKLGRLVVVQGQIRELAAQNTITLTSTTETTLIAAGAAGVFHDLSGLILTNTSATGVRVDFRDTTAGTVRFSIFLAANGGGAVVMPNTPFTQTTAALNWTAQLSAAVTDVRIFAQAIKNL